MSNTSANSARQTRSRNIKRAFVLLRNDDELRVPRSSTLKNLCDSGRVRDIEFSNNATSHHIGEILSNSFANFLSREEFARVKFYKTVGNTNVLSEVGNIDSMCGDALKLLFKYRGKVYLKASQDDASSRTDPGHDTNGGPALDDANSGRFESSPVRGGETQSDTDESEGSQVRMESEKEGSSESEMEISGESDEENSSGSGEDSDVIEVQSGSARAGPNRHSDISSDDEGVLLRPAFQSTPVPKAIQQKSKPVSSKTMAPVEVFINTLYDSVISSGARAEAGVCKDASEVGTVEEVRDHLLAAETDRESGPAHDIRVLQRLLACNNVPQRLPFLCLGAPEMRLQSHEDCRPVLIIRYQPKDKTVAVLRSIMQSAKCLKALGDFNIHVALVGSSFEDKALGKQGKRHEEVHDVELRIMHPTMVSSRMVVGNIVSGHERNFLEKLLEAAEEACQAAAALAAHRALIQEDRVLKRKQEEALRLSELNDRQKAQRVRETNSQTEVETECDDTIVDIDEVRQKRVLALGEQAESSKRQRREPDEGNDGEDSGTVTFKTS